MDYKIFDNPKPIQVIIRCIQITPDSIDDSENIILDFFAGSATTAHAVLDLNKQANVNRKFILVQLPEKCDADSEALRRAIKPSPKSARNAFAA